MSAGVGTVEPTDATPFGGRLISRLYLVPESKLMFETCYLAISLFLETSLGVTNLSHVRETV